MTSPQPLSQGEGTGIGQILISENYFDFTQLIILIKVEYRYNVQECDAKEAEY